MVHKILAVAFAVVSFNVLFYDLGWPIFGTLGFLFFINCFQVFLFLAYPANIKYQRHAYAGVLSLLAIVLGILSMFRANNVTIWILGLGSLGFSVTSWYLFSLTQGTIGAMGEFALIPFSLAWGWLKAAISLTIHSLPRLFEKVGNIKFFSPLGNNSMAKGAVVLFPILIFLLFLTALGNSQAYEVVSNLLNNLGWSGVNISANTAGRVSWSLLLVWILLPATFVQTSYGVKVPIKREVYRVLLIELIMLVAAVGVVIAFFLIAQFRYFFLIHSAQDLFEQGLFTFSNYVTKGFFELGIVACVVYLVVIASVIILKARKDDSRLLRGLNVLLLGLLLIFIGAVASRLYWYQYFHGLTRARIYGIFCVTMLIVFTLILVVRMIKKTYVGWHVLEFGVLIVAILTFGIVDVDKLSGEYFRPSVNNQTDYVYVSRLSSDAVKGWIDSFDHAKQALLVGKDNTHETTDVLRIIYASDTLSHVRLQYLTLAQKFGNSQILSELSYIPGSLPAETYEHALLQLAKINLSEWAAYRYLTSKINPIELVALEESAADIEAIMTQGRDYSLDRNYSSPMMW